VIGSNIFNILFILGIISLIKPINIQVSVLKFEFPILFLFSAFLLTIIKTKYKIIRSEGLVMLAGYLTFIFFLIRR
ncbi:sodium:calcium antiporter, partial [Methanosarcinales archaeon]